MEVLIKPESRVDFLSMYADRYGLEYAIIYDLERLDHSEITLSGRFDLIGEWHGSVPPMNGVEDVKRHRKILLYEVLPE